MREAATSPSISATCAPSPASTLSEARTASERFEAEGNVEVSWSHLCASPRSSLAPVTSGSDLSSTEPASDLRLCEAPLVDRNPQTRPLGQPEAARLTHQGRLEQAVRQLHDWGLELQHPQV